MCWIKQNSLAEQETVFSARSAEPQMQSINLGALSPCTNPLGYVKSLGCMVGDRVQGSWPLVLGPNSQHNAGKGSSHVSPLERHPRGNVPPKVQDRRGVPLRGRGAAAKTHSQLCLDSWEDSVSETWVLATVSKGYRIQFLSSGSVFGPGDFDPFTEGCDYESRSRQTARWLLLHVFPRAKKRCWVTTHLTPKAIKCLHKDTAFQDAEHRPEPRIYRGRGVVHFHRFTGCVLPRTNLSRPQTLSPRVFTRVMGAALSPLQLSGVKTLPYLDDWLICAPSLSQVVEDTKRVMPSCFTPMEGQGTFASRCPSLEHSIEKDGGNHRCLSNRLGSSLGRQDGTWCVVCGNPLGVAVTSTSWN